MNKQQQQPKLEILFPFDSQNSLLETILQFGFAETDVHGN